MEKLTPEARAELKKEIKKMLDQYKGHVNDDVLYREMFQKFKSKYHAADVEIAILEIIDASETDDIHPAFSGSKFETLGWIYRDMKKHPALLAYGAAFIGLIVLASVLLRMVA